MSLMAALRKSLLGIALEEATFVRRGFVPSPCQHRLEEVGRTFISGYNAALTNADAHVLADALRQINRELRGFAVEGAGMALAILDWLSAARLRRWQAFAQSHGADHIYMLHVGAGWAAARLPWIRRRLESKLSLFDPLLRWLVLDGYGFHQGYFHPKRYFAAGQRPQLSASGQQVFDQGLGRCLWFVTGADISLITRHIDSLAPSRRSDLWSGVGLACAYAGGADITALHQLASNTGVEYLPAISQGVAFAAKTRLRAGNMAEHTELAARVFCDTSAAAAASVTDDCLRDLPIDGSCTAYELWRHRIQQHYLDGRGAAHRESSITTVA